MLLKDFTKLILSASLILLLTVSKIFAQQTITGHVVSEEDNEPLPGVTVLIKGTTTGVITDLDGDFRIAASEGDVLMFSFVGFQSTEVTVGSQTQLNVSLPLDIQSLSEVVVLGYTSKSQKELGASVVSLDAKELQNVTAPNIETMLQGKVPGLTVSSPSGQPGVPADIRIRGVTSINIDRPPLIVVDGMIGGNYVPSDVENITVLKDAAAIGLYGSAGAAGVIIVTTKAGSSSAEPTFTVNSRVGFKEAVTGNFQMMNSAQLYDAQEQMWGEDNVISFLNNRPEDLLDQDFDWMDAGFQRAMLQNHSIGMRGANYGFNVDYYDEEGTFINTNYQRLNLRGYLKMDITDRFRVVTDVNGQLTSDRGNHYSWFEDVFWNVPWDQPTHMEDGVEVTSGPQYVTNSANGWIGQFKRNFLHSTKYNTLGSTGNDLTWSVRASYELTDWLSIETRTRLNTYRSKYKEYYAPNTDQGIAMNGIVNTTQNEGWGVLSTHFLRFSKAFGKHDFSAFVAHEGGYSTTNNLYLSVSNLSSQNISVPDGGSNALDWGGNRIETSGYSYISEVSYGYDGKYFLTGYWRADASSVFAKDTRVGYFPGGSIAWLISEEDVMSSPLIDQLKLRASYGLVGNSNIQPFLSLPTYNITRQYNGNPGGEPDNPENNELSWETTRMANIGIDFVMSNGVFTNIDVYHKSVENMLFYNPQAFSSGYERKWENTGDMYNRGIEAVLGYSGSVGDLQVNASFNVAVNQNEVTRISSTSDEQPLIAGNIQQINIVGSPAFTWYMPKWRGVNPDDGTPQWEVINYDVDGNETGRSVTSNYNQATFQPIASALPKMNGGFNASLGYKGFNLSFLITYQTGNSIYHYTREFVDSDGANIGINLMQLQDGWSRWEAPGDQATHPGLERGGNNGAHFTSSRYIEDGDFLRLRNVNLSYNLPVRLLKWSGMKAATVSVSADNLITLTNFSGMDPDIGLQVQDYSLPGMSYLKYPISKQIVLGLNLNF